jgi:hypothetical protein
MKLPAAQAESLRPLPRSKSEVALKTHPGSSFESGETRDEDQFNLLGVDGRSEKTTGKQNRRKT